MITEDATISPWDRHAATEEQAKHRIVHPIVTVFPFHTPFCMKMGTVTTGMALSRLTAQLLAALKIQGSRLSTAMCWNDNGGAARRVHFLESFACVRFNVILQLNK